MKNRTKKILFFSCEPGGAEVLIPVIKLVNSQPQFETVVLGYGYAMERFSKKQIPCSEITPVEIDDLSLISLHSPDLIITSATSLPSADMTEKYLWWQARRLGIPSLAFLDQWQNYAIRFSGIKDHERLAYLPDWINCLNEMGREEMISEGFDEGKLVTFGHPYLSTLKHDLPALNLPRLRSSLDISSEDKIALFVSEPIQEYYGNKRGYDQYQVLDYFLTNLGEATVPPKIIIKIHPKERLQSFQALAKKFETLSPRFIGNELSSLECLAVSDYVFGMSSIMLVEAYVLGKMVVSLQPGLCVQDPMVLSRHELIPNVSNGKKCNLLKLGSPPYPRFDIEFETDKLLHFIHAIDR